MSRKLDCHVIVRLDKAMYDAVKRDADDNERTMSQTIRLHLRPLLATPKEPVP